MEVEKVIDLTRNGNGNTIYYVLLPILGILFYHITFQIITKLNRCLKKVTQIEHDIDTIKSDLEKIKDHLFL